MLTRGPRVASREAKVTSQEVRTDFDPFPQDSQSMIRSADGQLDAHAGTTAYLKPDRLQRVESRDMFLSVKPPIVDDALQGYRFGK